MKNTNDIKLALRDATAAVNLLDKRGYQVIGLNMDYVKPVITIKTPPAKKVLAGTDIQSIRNRGSEPERIMAAHLHGCLVTWNADALTSQAQN